MPLLRIYAIGTFSPLPAPPPPHTLFQKDICIQGFMGKRMLLVMGTGVRGGVCCGESRNLLVCGGGK